MRIQKLLAQKIRDTLLFYKHCTMSNMASFFTDSRRTFLVNSLLPVQLCRQAPRPKGQLHEASSGGDNDQDGSAREGVNEEQAAGK